MDYAYRMYKNVRYYYEQINPATLSGAIDVIVVEQPNGDFHSTPFHVRFGKYGVFNYKEKYVDVSINGKEVKDIRMKLGENGIAFFVEETSGIVPDYLVTSPVPGFPRPTTDKVLAETSRTLEKHLADGRHGSKAIPIGGVRTPPPGSPPGGFATSPTSVIRRSKSMVRGRVAAKLIGEGRKAADDEVTIQQRKMTLPMLDSIFSMRRNRSLPNLSSTGLEPEPASQSSSSQSKKTPVAPTVSTTAASTTTAAPSVSVGAPPVSSNTPNAHKTAQRKTRYRGTKSHYQERKKQPKESDDKKKREGSTSSSDSGPPTPIQSGKPSAFTSSNPIAINVTREEDRGESSSSSTLSSPSNSLLDANDAARIAEGALSDTEVERHKRDGAPMEQHGSDVAEWSWGQFPKTMDEQKKEKEPEKPKSTSWWWWRSSAASSTPDKKAAGGQTGGAEESALFPFIWTIDDADKEGIYLDDLLKQSEGADPNKLQRYIGRPSSQSMDADSGNGSGLTTSPSSPSARSIPDDVAAVDGLHDKDLSIPYQTAMSEDEDITQGSDEFLRDEKTGMTYFRSLRLSSDRLKTLGLQWGANECRFSITTKFQGTTWCACNIYLYKHTEKIVISDIDGTITKSDVLGHVIPAIGGQWAHAGVAELYTRIKSNGYKLVYLSSRAIGQASITKKYLKTVEQDQRVLPDGPVLLAPDSVLVAFRREVIERRPEEFKIAALSDLKKLFPTKKPFFAGFGNRETDTKSYRAVGIDDSRILIIDPSGTVKRSDCVGYKSSYKCMAQDSVDCIFPPILDERAQKKPILTALSFSRPQTDSSYTFWANADKGNVSDDELAKYEARRKKKK
ncbi:lpin-1 [Pristionchus pacificus]|uniref:Lpin-1 n=1 Tax=Pristionchus pacificus TaxID=54126 RepID=A0A2A6CSU4_PRIPA|nr:lpin-1 [Pristionchus pacificus]|eukprot:PDM81178.1 lpin-1 [Pristionchus pacificus]